MKATTGGTRSATIVGGSLGGLFTGHLLRHIGWDVTIHERSPGHMNSRGGGIVLQPAVEQALEIAGVDPSDPIGVDVVERVFFDQEGRVLQRVPMRQTMTSWAVLYHALRSRFPDESYRTEEALVRLDGDGPTIRSTFSSGHSAAAPLLVGADGIDSTTRAYVSGTASVNYAGYVAYRGVVDEGDLPPRVGRELTDRFAFQQWQGSHILQYLIPGPEGSVEPGHRSFNWVWYVNRDEYSELPEVLTDRDGQQRRYSIPPGMISERGRQELLVRAERSLCPQFLELVRATREPFIQAIADLSVERMVRDRVALIGDAAFVPRPHTAASTAKAAANAISLAEALIGADHEVERALHRWEPLQLRYGGQLFVQGKALGDRSQFPLGAWGT